MGLFTPPSAEDLLLQQARQGDRRSLAQLVQAHQAMAYTVALRVLGQEQDAEEVVQDAFLKAFGALKGFNQAAKFSTWLYRIVYNTALTKRRSRSLVTRDLAAPPRTGSRPASGAEGVGIAQASGAQNVYCVSFKPLAAG